MTMSTKNPKRSRILTTVLGILLVALICHQYWTVLAVQEEISKVRSDMASFRSDVDAARAIEWNPPPKNLTWRVASEDAARFINYNLQGVKALPARTALLEYALKKVDPKIEGLYAEFGVFKGGTINFIADQTDHTIHGFDSFEGLPEKWRQGIGKGTFAMDGLPEVRGNVLLYKGWFSDSLPGFLERYPQKAAFLHMDADLYSSTRTVFELMADRIVPGTVIVFDEFYGFPGWRAGEYKAFNEMVDSLGLTFEYIGYVLTHEQVAVRITGKKDAL